jgi:hypothetical protein
MPSIPGIMHGGQGHVKYGHGKFKGGKKHKGGKKGKGFMGGMKGKGFLGGKHKWK